MNRKGIEMEKGVDHRGRFRNRRIHGSLVRQAGGKFVFRSKAGKTSV